jgi:hypothetical protein
VFSTDRISAIAVEIFRTAESSVITAIPAITATNERTVSATNARANHATNTTAAKPVQPPHTTTARANHATSTTAAKPVRHPNATPRAKNALVVADPATPSTHVSASTTSTAPASLRLTRPFTPKERKKRSNWPQLACAACTQLSTPPALTQKT